MSKDIAEIIRERRMPHLVEEEKEKEFKKKVRRLLKRIDKEVCCDDEIIAKVKRLIVKTLLEE
ncbi:MAG: hypothetical protein DRJ64_06665 [Thermoprotei archaeon]|nr:MAG: hypothetical protein DRJ64_06665 [Thermoprotei archaeon]